MAVKADPNNLPQSSRRKPGYSLIICRRVGAPLLPDERFRPCGTLLKMDRIDVTRLGLKVLTRTFGKACVTSLPCSRSRTRATSLERIIQRKFLFGFQAQNKLLKSVSDMRNRIVDLLIHVNNPRFAGCSA